MFNSFKGYIENSIVANVASTAGVNIDSLVSSSSSKQSKPNSFHGIVSVDDVSIDINKKSSNRLIICGYLGPIYDSSVSSYFIFFFKQKNLHFILL